MGVQRQPQRRQGRSDKWKKRRLISRKDAMEMDSRGLVKFTRDSGYSGEQWRNSQMQLINRSIDKAAYVQSLMTEQENDLWSEVLRLQRQPVTIDDADRE